MTIRGGSILLCAAIAAPVLARAHAGGLGAPGGGAPRERGEGTTPPAALVYAVEEALLTASDAAASDAFGTAVALSVDGQFAIVGVPGDDVGANADAGSARVFTRSGTAWLETAALVRTSTRAG